MMTCTLSCRRRSFDFNFRIEEDSYTAHHGCGVQSLNGACAFREEFFEHIQMRGLGHILPLLANLARNAELHSQTLSTKRSSVLLIAEMLCEADTNINARGLGGDDSP